jgi:iron complex outermembrane receptor protein
VLGVKKFYNAGNARLRGFEFSYGTPEHNKLGLQLFSSYTYGTIDQAHQYVMNDAGQVVDENVLENDALTEIPPWEASLFLHYKMFDDRLVPELNLRMVGAQNHVSEASYENPSKQFFVTGLSISYQFNKFVYISTGVNNLFDVAYYEHLNRNIIGSTTSLYEPGRSFYFNLSFNF